MRLGIVFIPLSLWIRGPFISASRKKGTSAHALSALKSSALAVADADKHADRIARCDNATARG